MAKCDGKNCGADIVWAETPDGKRQPFDREPDPKGNRVLLGRGPDRPPLALPIGWLAGPDVRDAEDSRRRVEAITDGCRYTPHHATCPDVERFR